MSELDRSDWLSSPYTKELIKDMDEIKRHLEESLGGGCCAGDTIDTTAQAYANIIGRISSITDILDEFILKTEVEEPKDYDVSPGNVAESYNDEA